MSATRSTVIPPAASKKPGSLSRSLSACMDRIAHYFIHRAATRHLCELEDWALRDIGLARSHIKAAVRGSSVASRS